MLIGLFLVFLPAICSLEQRARYLFYCRLRFFVCSFFCQRFLHNPAGRFKPYFACGCILVPNVTSPLLGVGGPRRAEKWKKWNFRYYRSQWGIFAFWRFLSDISATRRRIHAKFYLYRDNVCRRAPSSSGVHRSLGAEGGGVKTSKNGGWSHSCIGQLPFLFFSALPNVVQYVGQRTTHILV